MTNSDPEGQIFLYLTRLMDSFSCSPLNTAFYVLKKAHRSSRYAEMQHDMITSFLHINDVTFDDLLREF